MGESIKLLVGEEGMEEEVLRWIHKVLIKMLVRYLQLQMAFKPSSVILACSIGAETKERWVNKGQFLATTHKSSSFRAGQSSWRMRRLLHFWIVLRKPVGLTSPWAHCALEVRRCRMDMYGR